MNFHSLQQAKRNLKCDDLHEVNQLYLQSQFQIFLQFFQGSPASKDS